MANLQQEYPLVLLGILEELANMRHWLSFQDLCRMVSTRFDLEHLVELRSLLFSAACRDSCFPATLFRDRVTTRGLGLSPIGVAADIVTIFNLIQMTGSAGDETHPMRSQLIFPVDQSPGPFFPSADEGRFAGHDWTHAHSDSGSRTIDQRMLFPKSNYSVRKRSSLPPDPISLVSSPPARARAVSFDWPHNTSLFSSGRLPGQAMQSIYLPLETDSESSTQDSLSGDSAPKDVFEPGQEESCVKRRDIFKKDFHNQSPLIPQVTISSDSPSPRGVHENLFPNHSFEVLTNPYPSPTATRPSPERRAKHESFDDLQDSTYFGPACSPEWSTVHLQPPRSQNTAWTEKSLSVDSNVGSRRAMLDSIPSHPSRSTPALNPGASSGRARAGKHGDDEVVASTGTQTDPPDPRRLRSLVHADRLSFMTSLDDPDMMCEDDISAIFRFLDDMSVCGSTGVLHPHDGGGGPANQDSHEARRGRLGQLQRLFHSLESSDDGVKSSVCKLLLRMSQIERQLESLSEVKAEISQVLSALRRLDEKIQDPSAIAGAGDRGRWLGPPSAGLSSMGSPMVTPDTESSEPQPLSVSGHLFPGASSGSLDWNKWNASGEPKEASGSQIDVKGGKAGKKGILSSRRASKSQSEEKSAAERPSVSYSARDWAVSFSKDKVGKAIHGKTGQMEQTTSTSNLLSSKPSHLVGQVFNSALFRQKGGGINSGFINDPRLAEGGPVWTVEERISPLDLQARESLNPNNVDFWMEDIYTPGYDALLRRKEADLRRAKACKVGAIIATAISIILVIVIPLCTMRS